MTQTNEEIEKDVPAAEEKNDGDAGMTFWEHLEVLRWSLMRVVIVLLVFVVGCFMAMPYIFDDFVLGPTSSDFFLYRWLSGLPFFNFADKSFHVDIININVASQFMTHITTSFWFSLVLIFPYLIFEIWKFIRPALFKNEKKSIGFAFGFGTFMFFLGCAVGYCLVFPFTFRFLTEYQISESITNQINLNSYMGNFLMMIFVMGVVFELPLLSWVLSRLGIVDREFLKKYRRHAVVVLLVLSAIITPSGDPSFRYTCCMNWASGSPAASRQKRNNQDLILPVRHRWEGPTGPHRSVSEVSCMGTEAVQVPAERSGAACPTGAVTAGDWGCIDRISGRNP